MIRKLIFLLTIFSFFSSGLYAQEVSYDDQKYKQWNSMENGGWDFSPDFYYYLFHKNYSGAKLKWQWKGFKSGFVVEFDETKSNVKRVITERLAQIYAAEETKNKTQAELDTITPLFEEEFIRSTERNKDLMYSQFKNDFEELQSNISELLSYSLQKSNGKLSEAVQIIQNQNDIILSNIAYIHKEGLGYEMENTKRQIAYEEQLDKMKKLASVCADLVFYAKSFY